MRYDNAHIEAMRYFKHFIFILITLFTVNAVAGYSSQMTPTFDEKLSDPIALTGVCSKVNIVEWRGEVPMTQSAINRLKRSCEDAMSNFPKFVKSKGYKIKKPGKLHTSICLMPVNSNPRNLNDIDYRFSSRTMTFDENGNVDPIWGYFQRHTNHIYLRDSSVTYHKVVFVHEMFHAASYYYGIYNQHKGNKNLKDERMARDFTDYIGYGR